MKAGFIGHALTNGSGHEPNGNGWDVQPTWNQCRDPTVCQLSGKLSVAEASGGRHGRLAGEERCKFPDYALRL